MRTQLISKAVPMEIRWLLAVAGWLLPPAQRSDWLREWYAEFWHCFESGREFRREMWTRACGAFPDAWFLLRHRYGIAKRIQDASRSRSAPVIFLALLIVATILVTNGFSRGRDLLLHDDSGLVLITQPSPFMGGRSHMPVAQAERWFEASQTVAELGVWSIDEQHVCSADTAARTLLSEAPVKPACQRMEAMGSNVPPFAGIVARLRNGASIHQVQQELAQTAPLHKGWMRPAAVSLAGLRKTPLSPIGLALLGLLLLSILAVRAITISACIWAASKIAFSFALIAGLWIELVARAPSTETGGIPVVWTVLLYLLPLIAGCSAAWWFRRDAHRRCRICYRRLTMPVTVGIPGWCLFDPSGTEYLCGFGHGALLVGPSNGAIEEKAWATWSESWV